MEPAKAISTILDDLFVLYRVFNMHFYWKKDYEKVAIFGMLAALLLEVLAK